MDAYWHILEIVDTASAVSTLRRKTGFSQAQLARRLGTVVATISRWENNRREPGDQALKALAAIAEEAEANSLQKFFEGRRRSGIVGRIANLRSAGTQRRVSVDFLEDWLNWLALISGVAGQLDRELAGELDQMQREGLLGVQRIAEQLSGEIELHLKGKALKRILPLSNNQTERLRELLTPIERKEKHAKTK